LDSAEYYVKMAEEILVPAKKVFREMEVWNTLSWRRSAFVESESPRGIDSLMLLDEKGRNVSFEYVPQKDEIYFIAENIPANGSAPYRFVHREPGVESKAKKFTSWHSGLDPVTGAVKRLKRN